MRRTTGFTLIEILVALALFAVVGGTLLQLFQSGLRNGRIADDHTHAVFLARSKLTELQAHTHLRAGRLSGRFDNGYRWEAVLEEREAADPATPRWLTPLMLELDVSWGDEGDERTFTLRSLLLSRATPS